MRLIGFLWALLDGESLLLLEEPELSLHSGVVRQLAGLMFRVLKNKRQVIATTHSADLLSDKGIGPNEIALLNLGNEGTEVHLGAEIDDVHKMMKQGLTAEEVIIPRTRPARIGQISLFE